MKIQAAIDRVSVERAAEIIGETGGYADIVEVGTSLIKDFGLAGSVGVLKKQFPEQVMLADIKTCDEGAYEFEQAYKAGADIATVMGFSSLSTIRACAEIARKYEKDYLIDLLETGGGRIQALAEAFPDAMFCLHLPSDQNGEGLEELVVRMTGKLQDVKAIAVAGGVTLSSVDLMKQCGVDLVIVGGAITKASDIRSAAAAFAEACRTF